MFVRACVCVYTYVCVHVCVCVCVSAPESPPFCLPHQPAWGQRTENKQKKGGDGPQSKVQATNWCLPHRALSLGHELLKKCLRVSYVEGVPPRVGIRAPWGHRKVI